MAVDKLVDSTQLNADLTSVANAIRAKGGTSASLAFPAGFVDAIGDIETGGGVTVSPLSVTANGTYTAPSGEAYSPVTVNVSGGLPPAPADGKTRIYCRFETGRLAPFLGLGVNGTVEVDWGDGSSTDTLTGTSLTTVKTVRHTYSETGDYTITLTVESGGFAFFGVSTAAHILKKNILTTANISLVYANAVKRVEIGANANIGNYAFYKCYSLASVTISDSVTSIGNYAFYMCSGLSSITIPDSVTSIGGSAFYECYSLSSITIPDSVTSINDTMFYECCSLSSITIPDSVTSISSNAFSKCYGLGEIHFLPTTPPTLSSTNVFGNVPTDCKIYVPAGTLAAYTSATNYPSSSTYTYIEE